MYWDLWMYGFMDVILLQSNHQHISAFRVAIILFRCI